MTISIAVAVGVIFSALTYAWESAKHMSADVSHDKENDLKTYKLWGPLFFGSTTSFKALFTPKDDPKVVIVHFENSRVWDHSALEAIKSLATKYEREGKSIRFRGLSEDCINLLGRKGILATPNKESGPLYQVVVNH